MKLIFFTRLLTAQKTNDPFCLPAQKKYGHFVKVKMHRRGFTMIELLISITIFSLLSAVVLVKYNTFSVKSEFSNAAESIVLALREAQVYGVASKESAGGTGPIPCGPAGSPFDCVYGVHFSANAGENKQITVFIDENDDYVYRAGERIVETITWNGSIFIDKLECLPGASGFCTGNTMDVTFRRPNPDAFVTDVTPCSSAPPCISANGVFPVSYNSGVVVLSNGERTASTTITSAGQISLK